MLAASLASGRASNQAHEILDAWFDARPDASEAANIARLEP